MVGWWVDANPVKTGTKDVLATVFVRSPEGVAGGRETGDPYGLGPDPRGSRPNANGSSALIALASWAEGPVDVRLAVDWKKLGLDPKRAVLSAPAIDKFQEAAEFKPGDPIRVEPGQGRLLILR